MNFIMQVRTGGAARCADITDDLALGDAGADTDTAGKARLVGIHGLEPIGVAQAGVIAKAAIAVGAFNNTIAGCQNWRAARRGEIGAVMTAGITKDWMTTGAAEM